MNYQQPMFQRPVQFIVNVRGQAMGAIQKLLTKMHETGSDPRLAPEQFLGWYYLGPPFDGTVIIIEGDFWIQFAIDLLAELKRLNLDVQVWSSRPYPFFVELLPPLSLDREDDERMLPNVGDWQLIWEQLTKTKEKLDEGPEDEEEDAPPSEVLASLRSRFDQ